MDKKLLTEELLDDLLAAPRIDDFIDELNSNNDAGAPSLSDCLNSLLQEKGLTRSKVVSDAQINSTFGYQIFTGSRQASRDKILALAFAMRLNLRETSRLLQAGGANSLYAKSKRDAIIIFCIDHEYTLMKTNQELYRFGERTID